MMLYAIFITILITLRKRPLTPDKTFVGHLFLLFLLTYLYPFSVEIFVLILFLVPSYVGNASSRAYTPRPLHVSSHPPQVVQILLPLPTPPTSCSPPSFFHRSIYPPSTASVMVLSHQSKKTTIQGYNTNTSAIKNHTVYFHTVSNKTTTRHLNTIQCGTRQIGSAENKQKSKLSYN